MFEVVGNRCGQQLCNDQDGSVSQRFSRVNAAYGAIVIHNHSPLATRRPVREDALQKLVVGE